MGEVCGVCGRVGGWVVQQAHMLGLSKGGGWMWVCLGTSAGMVAGLTPTAWALGAY
jgi:hypothetical protein